MTDLKSTLLEQSTTKSTSDKRSTISLLASLPAKTREEVLSSLKEAEATELAYDFFKHWARENQRPPEGDWTYWLIEAGRGFGKTKVGACWGIEQAKEAGSRGALCGRTAADVRDTMIEGESGILASSPPDFMPHYEPSKRRLTWPNGSIATAFTAEKPDQLRGPQHHWAWCDELAAWSFQDAWDQIQFGLRLGDRPRCIITTTPRPIKRLRELHKDEDCVVTHGSSYDNFENLPQSFIKKILGKYKGTSLEQQEIFGKLMNEIPGALWKRMYIEPHRAIKKPKYAVQRVVGVDPSVHEDGEACEAGIVVASVTADGHVCVEADYTIHGSPKQWVRQVVKAYHETGASEVVAEGNQGGGLVAALIEGVDDSIPVQVVHASIGKRARAEPIVLKYQQGKVHHMEGLIDLEDQMCSWNPYEDRESPDRVDALVWACTHLLLGVELTAIY